jgi:hypothetical protein
VAYLAMVLREGVMNIVEAFEAWLPYPVYEFRGGPFDGRRITVNLIRTDEGYIAPEVWWVHLPIERIDFGVNEVTNAKVRVVSYRFVALYVHGRRSMNQGYYEFIS